ncbi:MAG TPA: H4MPT-linked C1 transfer pathway protein, partial [Archaeoglobus profundus]|nr:H4MPT-linked C1 transfer pathway protein [Archaeoglobus profundus]
MTSLGIDIGGANLKVADNHGNFKLIYFPIWKKLDKLEYQLRMIKDEFNADKIGVVMTAELSDIFDTKVEGVLKIAKIVSRVFEDVFFLDLNGELRRYDDVLKKPRMFAASNWVASVKFLIEEGWKYFIFGDIGSTTTDLIPVTDKIEAGRTDYERLKNGELIYFGVLRTPVF